MTTQQRLLTWSLFFCLYIGISSVSAWDNIHAHPFINGKAWDLFLRKYVSNVMSLKYQRATPDYVGTYQGLELTNSGFVRQSTSGSQGVMTARDWVRHGGMSADEPEGEMALRHFYDPLKLNGAHHLTDHVGNITFLPKIDAVTWALSHSENVYSLKSSLTYFRKAMQNQEYTVTDPLRGNETVGGKREQLFGAALRGLGEVMHLVADMANPAHVRNDSHPMYDMHESVVSDLLSDPDSDFARAVAAGSLPDDFALGQTPHDLFDKTARYVNANFYSNETIMNDSVPGDHDLCDHYFNMVPANWEARYPSPLLHHFAFQPKGSLYYYPNFRRLGPLDMVQSTYSSGFLAGLLKVVRSRTSSDFSIPPSFVEAQARVLLPIAVHACAKMADLFFPSLEVRMDCRQSDGEVRVGGTVVHAIDRDPAWKAFGEAISYAGPGRVMCRRGRTVIEVASITFQAGKADPELIIVPFPPAKPTPEHRVFAFLPGDRVYLQIDGGGMSRRSQEFEIRSQILDFLKVSKRLMIKIQGEPDCDPDDSAISSFLRSGSSMFQYFQNYDVKSTVFAPLRFNGLRFTAKGTMTTPLNKLHYPDILNAIGVHWFEKLRFDVEGRIATDGESIHEIRITMKRDTAELLGVGVIDLINSRLREEEDIAAAAGLPRPTAPNPLTAEYVRKTYARASVQHSQMLADLRVTKVPIERPKSDKKAPAPPLPLFGVSFLGDPKDSLDIVTWQYSTEERYFEGTVKDARKSVVKSLNRPTIEIRFSR